MEQERARLEQGQMAACFEQQEVVVALEMAVRVHLLVARSRWIRAAVRAWT